MISFPSTFNDSGVSIGKTPNNSYARELSDMVSSIKARNLKLSTPMQEQMYREENYNINKFNAILPMQGIYKGLANDETHNGYENTSNVSQDIINVLNNYKFQYKNQLNVKIGETGYQEADAEGNEKEGTRQKYKDVYAKINIAPSLFNPLYGVNVIGLAPNTPLLNGDIKDDKRIRTLISNTNDCSIKRLVLESKKVNSVLGNARYKYSDFMYCRDLGKISNMHLITLRKFAHPIGDNIFKLSSKKYKVDNDYDFQTEGDVGRLVTWFGNEENRLEDLLHYNFHSTWKPVDAQITTMPSKENNNDRGLAGGIINTLSGAFNRTYFNGTNDGNNSIWSFLGLAGAPDSTERAEYYNGTWDQHKIYTPKNTIQSTHLYEGKIEFSHEFTLTFAYKLRAYDNINPKAAMLDLLGNVLAVCGQRGRFWRGENRIIGPPQNKSAWKKANALIDGAGQELGGLFDALFSSKNISEIIGNAANWAQQILNVAYDAVSNIDWGNISQLLLQGVTNIVGNFTNADGSPNASEAIKGILHNQLGRPAVYMFPSLLSGDDVGLWHVTIGNPLNPIIAFGNLILEDTEVVQSGPLGIDGFPTELKVICKLKHARPRDAVAISRMYTLGTTDIYYPLGSMKLSGLYNTGLDIKENEYDEAGKVRDSYGYKFKYVDLSDEEREILRKDEEDRKLNAFFDNEFENFQDASKHLDALNNTPSTSSLKNQIYTQVDAWDADSYMINMTNQVSWRDARHVIDEITT